MSINRVKAFMAGPTGKAISNAGVGFVLGLMVATVFVAKQQIVLEERLHASKTAQALSSAVQKIEHTKSRG